MPVSPLLDAARPAAVFAGSYPSAFSRRLCYAEMRPSFAVCRMFNNSSILPYSGKGSLEAAPVITQLFPLSRPGNPCRLSSIHLSPSLARRVRYYRVRPYILSSVPLFIPRVYILNSKVRPVASDKKSSQQIASPLGRGAKTTLSQGRSAPGGFRASSRSIFPALLVTG